jgi:hypothetical protein
MTAIVQAKSKSASVASDTPTVGLSTVELPIQGVPLREHVAKRILTLFEISLIGTLAFAAILVLIDAFFIFFKVINPAERLMTEKVIMTFVTATVVEVGAALAAIVFAVFKTDAQANGEDAK